MVTHAAHLNPIEPVSAGKSVDDEQKWQREKLQTLPPDLVETVLAMWRRKEFDRRI